MQPKGGEEFAFDDLALFVQAMGDTAVKSDVEVRGVLTLAGAYDSEMERIRLSGATPEAQRAARTELGASIYTKIKAWEEKTDAAFAPSLERARKELFDAEDPPDGAERRRAYEKLDPLQVEVLLASGEMDFRDVEALALAPKRPVIGADGVPRLERPVSEDALKAAFRHKRPHEAETFDVIEVRRLSVRALGNHLRQITGSKLDRWHAAPLEFSWRRR